MYKYVKAFWNDPKDMDQFLRNRLVQWRREPASLRIEYPTRLDRARSLGYKAKQGIILVRQRVPRGGHRKPFPSGGRRSKKWTTTKTLALNYRTIAEQRVSKHYPNCEVLNSYEVGQDGRNFWFEIILVDVAHPAVKANPQLSWMANHRGRAFRGLTSSAKKSRGLYNKGLGAEKLRPSKSADRNIRRNRDTRLKHLAHLKRRTSKKLM